MELRYRIRVGRVGEEGVKTFGSLFGQVGRSLRVTCIRFLLDSDFKPSVTWSLYCEVYELRSLQLVNCKLCIMRGRGILFF